MITTLIHFVDNNTIELQPINVNSSKFQEFQCHIFDSGSGKHNSAWIYRTDQTFTISTSNILDETKVLSDGVYYIYVCFKNRRPVKFGLCKDGYSPVNYAYYTRINYGLTVTSGSITLFSDTEIINGLSNNESNKIDKAPLPTTAGNIVIFSDADSNVEDSGIPISTLTDDIKQTYAEVEASEYIPKYKIVTTDGYICNSIYPSHRHKSVGIATNNTNIGFNCNCVVKGIIEDATFSFTPNATLYLNGTNISTTAPTTGFILPLGKSVTSNKILIDIQRSILL